MNKIGVSGLVTVFDVDTTSNTIWIGPHTEITSHTSVIRHPYTNVIYGVPNRLSCSDVAIVGTYGVSEEELQTLEDYFYSFVTVSDGINGSQIKREKDISSEVEVFATTTTQEKMRDLVDYNSIISYKRNNYAVL